MAVVRARSSPPYALIVFVFLTVISAGLAIYFSVGKNDAEKKMADAETKLKDTRTSSDSKFVQQLEDVRKSGNNKSVSLLSVAANEIDSLKRLIVVDNNNATPPSVVVFDTSELLKNVGNGDMTLTDALKASNKLVLAGNSEIAGLKQQLKEQQDRVDQMLASGRTSTESSNTTLAQLKDQLTAAQTSLAAAQKEKEDYASKAQQNLASEKTAMEDERRKCLLEKEDLIGKIASLEGQIDDLKKLIKTQEAPTVALAPAGRIVRTRPASDECYIDLGTKDRVVVGLTFSVHDPRIGIKGKVEDPSAAEDVAAAGKGGIEVLEVGPTESLCRITHTTKGQMITAGDLISNPVYQNSKNRKYHFVVIGDFDLDGDGVATGAERDRVAHLIAAWGGVIDDKLTPQTDYLVAGTEPAAAAASSSEDQPGSVADARNGIRQSYEDTITAAKQSSVPILNANRFLAMVGYYDTTVVK